MTSIEDDYEAEVSAEYDEAMFLRMAIDAANLGHHWDIEGWAPKDAIALKFSDPTDGACWIGNRDYLLDVLKTDAGLIAWVRPGWKS